jgi:maltose O-acetyltransferase
MGKVRCRYLPSLDRNCYGVPCEAEALAQQFGDPTALVPLSVSLGTPLSAPTPHSMSTERDRMLAGEFYNSRDPELLDTAHRARCLLAEYNASPSSDGEGRLALLRQLLGAVGDGVWIEPPFFCDYGPQIAIGAHTFVNVNCVFLDSAAITIGEKVLLGPGVQLLTAFHPLHASERLPANWTPASGESPYRTQAAPIRIGDNVWIGAGTLVMPGVSIGDNSTIGAGSLVTKDIPANVLAFGQPCQVQRDLTGGAPHAT